MPLPSSQYSGGQTIPFPQPEGLQLLSQPSQLVIFPSSQSSMPVLMPLPQPVMVQLLSHPSPFVMLLSSHCSPGSTTPLRHPMGTHWFGLAVVLQTVPMGQDALLEHAQMFPGRSHRPL